MLLFKCQLSLQFYYVNYRKTSVGVYDRIINLPNVEGCKILQGMKTIPLLLGIKELLESSDGNIFSACSSTGEIAMANFTLANSSIVKLWPSGEFKTVVKFYDKIDDNIFNVTFLSVKQIENKIDLNFENFPQGARFNFGPILIWRLF